MDKTKIQKSIKLFTERVKNKFNPKQILLFGSYATGRANEYSDIDIIVLADKFKSIPTERRLDILYPLTQDLYPDFHVFGYTPEEFQKANFLTVIAEAKERGISLI